MSEDIMKAIPLLDGYLASTNGYIFSMKRKCRLCQPPTQPRPLTRIPDKDGYLQVRLHHNGKMLNRTVHRLVLETFVGPRPKGMQACHNDGDRANCVLNNLRWDTCKNNHKDKEKHGTIARGEKQGSSKLTASDIREVRLFCTRNRRGAQAKIAKKLNVHPSNISVIMRGLGWRHVT